ncbi:MAG TPA: hotdog domain-containing protein [Alphaproteobacteria bacterium]|nr:hotdog domain-containing protein [Alphaproteobacteria bacterium]
MAGISAGASTTRRFTIDKERTISFMGEDLRVYATPSMVLDVERTCRDFLVQFLKDGEDSVGARVEIDHLGPTLLGMWVDVTAKIAAVEGPRVVFEVEVKDALDTVGKAKHIRFVVDKARQKQRLEAKAAKAKAAG